MRNRFMIGFGILFLLGGIILFGVGFVANDYKFSNYGFEAGFGEEEKSFSPDLKINLVAERGKISLKIGTGSDIKVKWHYSEKYIVEVSENDGTLMINATTDYNFFDYITPNWGSDYLIEITVPGDYNQQIYIENETGSTKISGIENEQVTIKSSTGSIDIEKAKITNLKITISTGNIDIEDVETTVLVCTATTGNIEIDDVKTTTVDIKLTTGSTSIDELVAEQVVIKNTTGNVKVEDSNIMNIKTENGSGKTTINRTLIGESIKCDTRSGRIIITLKNAKSDFTIFTSVGSGSCNINSGGNGQKRMDVSVRSGKITVNFS